jgi:ABC-type sugar transport system ATPase subunit
MSYSAEETMQTPNVDPSPKVLLRLKSIVKAFAGVQALKGVDFDLRAGEVHALMGENGAGKSTLMKILFGLQPPDSGTIEIADHGEVSIDDPRHALALGVGLVSQEPDSARKPPHSFSRKTELPWLFWI